MRVHARGFTLIEVLVTVVILAVLASVLVLSVSAGDGEQWLRREADRLQARIEYACERAELTGRDLGLHLRRDGYAFSSAHGDEWRFINDDSALNAATLPKQMTLAAGDDDLAEAYNERPQFLCFASGEATPLQIELAAAANAPRWRIDIAFDGATRLARRGPDDRDWIETGMQR